MCFFEFVFSKLKCVDKKSAIIIGDNRNSDIKGGNDFGIDTCWYNIRKCEKNEIIPTFEISKLSELNAYEQIIKQIFFLEKQILKDSQLFEKGSFLHVDYEDLGLEFNNTLKLCCDFIKTNNKSEFLDAEIKIIERLSLDNAEITKFNNEIKKLNWKSYNDC